MSGSKNIETHENPVILGLKDCSGIAGGNSVILTTLERRAKYGKISPDDTCIYYLKTAE